MEQEERDSSLSGSEPSAVTEEEQSWISWFCSLRGNEFFCEVDEDYIHDEFNLTGLSAEVNFFDYALDTILDVDSPNADLLNEEQQELVDAAAECLYGLIHARYIITTKGLNAMYDKFVEYDFGRCPRVLCEDAPLLPVGRSDLPRKHTVSLYCPRCNDVYQPKSTRHTTVDGSYFGTTFAHLFLMTFPNCIPRPPDAAYTPRVFGFRIRRVEGEAAGGAGVGAPGGADGAPPTAASGAASAAAPPAAVGLPLVAVTADGRSIREAGPAGGPAAPLSLSELHAQQRRATAPTATAPAASGGSGLPFNTVFPDAVPPRIRQVATVLPRETAQARRRAGVDDFFDASELDDDPAAASAVGGGAAAADPTPLGGPAAAASAGSRASAPHSAHTATPSSAVAGASSAAALGGGGALSSAGFAVSPVGDIVDDDYVDERGRAGQGGDDDDEEEEEQIGFADVLSADRNRAGRHGGLAAVVGDSWDIPAAPGDAAGQAAGRMSLGSAVRRASGGLSTLTGPVGVLQVAAAPAR